MPISVYESGPFNPDDSTSRVVAEQVATVAEGAVAPSSSNNGSGGADGNSGSGSGSGRDRSSSG